eukprot:scpid10283/ scgid18063/ PRELI domain-containing protein 1, mitochondrial
MSAEGRMYYETSTLKHSWDDVVHVFWNRYPNPFAKHVLSEDTLQRKVVNKKLFSTRLLVKSGVLPKWGEFMFKDKSTKSIIVENSIVDPEKKTITTYTRNVSLTSFSVFEEKCTYRPSTDDKNWTVCERSASVTSSVRILGPRIAQFLVSRYSHGVQRSDRGWDYVLNKFQNRSPNSVMAALARTGVHKQAKLVRP